MADRLDPTGRFYFLNGLKPQIRKIELVTSAEAVVSTVTGLAGTEFTTLALSQFLITPAEQYLSNSVVIDFTIEAADIGETVAALILKDIDDRSLARIDLDTTKLLDTEGTFRFAVDGIKVNT